VLLFISSREAFSSAIPAPASPDAPAAFRAGGIALAQQIAHPRGNNVRVIRVNQLQAIERLAHQIFTFAGLAEADLLQQMLLNRGSRRLRQRHQRDAGERE
jgi:hypothetical protein